MTEGLGVEVECPQCEYETILFGDVQREYECPHCETGKDAESIGDLFVGDDDESVWLVPKLESSGGSDDE